MLKKKKKKSAVAFSLSLKYSSRNFSKRQGAVSISYKRNLSYKMTGFLPLSTFMKGFLPLLYLFQPMREIGQHCCPPAPLAVC